MKTLIILYFGLLPCAALAQTHKPFKVGVAAGYGIQPVSGAKGGVLVGIEPRYSLSDRFELGVRFEGAFPSQVVPAAVYRPSEASRFESTPVVSTIVTVNYWLLSGHRSGASVRPCIGIGLGSYWASSSTYQTTISDNGAASVEGIGRSASRFGGMIRAGLKTGHLNVSGEYNLLGSTTQQDADYSQSAILGSVNGQPIYENTTRTLTWTTRNAYVGLKIGLDIGGGQR